ncbi:MAG: cation transporter [Gemmatimonadales bacterium]|jgi:copper chaperone CopZ
MASVKLDITGMHCDHCNMKVENALKDVKGVYAVMVDRDAGSAEVDYDETRATADQLTAAVERVGYGAAVAS